MTIVEVIRAMMAQSGMTNRRLSTTLGREESFIGTTLYKKQKPSVLLFARIADACGYDTLVRRRDDGTELVLGVSDDK